MFLAHKDEAFSFFTKLCCKIQNAKCFLITIIRTDHGRELENEKFELFCNENGIGHNFSAPRTPQQNSIVERKNRTLEFGNVESQTLVIFMCLVVDVLCTLMVKITWVSFIQNPINQFFLGYSLTSKAYRAFNKRTFVVEESIRI